MICIKKATSLPQLVLPLLRLGRRLLHTGWVIDGIVAAHNHSHSVAAAAVAVLFCWPMAGAVRSQRPAIPPWHNRRRGRRGILWKKGGCIWRIKLHQNYLSILFWLEFCFFRGPSLLQRLSPSQRWHFCQPWEATCLQCGVQPLRSTVEKLGN